MSGTTEDAQFHGVDVREHAQRQPSVPTPSTDPQRLGGAHVLHERLRHLRLACFRQFQPRGPLVGVRDTSDGVHPGEPFHPP